MKKNRRIAVTSLLAILCCCTIIPVFLDSEVAAKSPVPVEGVKFDVGLSMKDNLKSLVGKDVHVHLSCGKTLQGFVKAVGETAVHLEKIANRDFFDALIMIQDIDAIEVKFRDMR